MCLDTKVASDMILKMNNKERVEYLPVTYTMTHSLAPSLDAFRLFHSLLAQP